MAEVYSSDGKTCLGHIDVQPECGEHFCDYCGDCLHCYGDDECPDGGHRFVIYEENLTDEQRKLLEKPHD